jgi:hypothetical protein
MSPQQLGEAVGQSARRLASDYEIDRYCGPVVRLVQAIADAPRKPSATAKKL